VYRVSASARAPLPSPAPHTLDTSLPPPRDPGGPALLRPPAGKGCRDRPETLNILVRGGLVAAGQLLNTASSSALSRGEATIRARLVNKQIYSYTAELGIASGASRHLR
jgi:hypothetical protein